MADRLGDWLENLRASVTGITRPMRRMLDTVACLVSPAVRFVHCCNLCWGYHRIRFVIQPWEYETASRYAVCKHISPVRWGFPCPLHECRFTSRANTPLSIEQEPGWAPGAICEFEEEKNLIFLPGINRTPAGAAHILVTLLTMPHFRMILK